MLKRQDRTPRYDSRPCGTSVRVPSGVPPQLRNTSIINCLFFALDHLIKNGEGARGGVCQDECCVESRVKTT